MQSMSALELTAFADWPFLTDSQYIRKHEAYLNPYNFFFYNAPAHNPLHEQRETRSLRLARETRLIVGLKINCCARPHHIPNK